MTGYGPPPWPQNGIDARGPLLELRGMLEAGRPPAQMAQDVVRRYGRPTANPRRVLTAQEYLRYKSAVKSKNWPEADLTYARGLAIKRPVEFDAMRSAEGYARALNVILTENLPLIPTLRRRIGLAELEGYKHRAFESRIEADGGRRGVKSFSMYENDYFKNRPVKVIVTIDERIRRAVRPVGYTALPRLTDPSKERMGDGKHLRYAGETECVVPDGTPIPPDTQIQIERGKIPRADIARAYSMRDQLEGVASVSFI